MLYSIGALYIWTLVCFAVVSGDKKVEKGPKLVIDNDAGGDDAMAIFLALLYEKHFNGPQLVGLTTGNGNTNEDNVCLNNQRILKVAGRQDIPIFRGSKSSLVTTPESGSYYGQDGLGDSGEVPDGLLPPHEQHAVSALIRLSKEYTGYLTVITIGTLTNVALAIKMDPDFLGRLSQLYVGAGNIHSEKHPDAEFNALMDVEAYHVIAQHASSDKVTIFPFSQTKDHLNISRTWRLNELGAIKSSIMTAQNIYERVALERSEHWAALDPSVVAAAIKPDLVQEYKYAEHDILMCGEKRGINTNTFVSKEDANVRMIYSLKLNEYKKFLIDVFSSAIIK